MFNATELGSSDCWINLGKGLCQLHWKGCKDCDESEWRKEQMW